jgi:hypothetical protein
MKFALLRGPHWLMDLQLTVEGNLSRRGQWIFSEMAVALQKGFSNWQNLWRKKCKNYNLFICTKKPLSYESHLIWNSLCYIRKGIIQSGTILNIISAQCQEIFSLVSVNSKIPERVFSCMFIISFLFYLNTQWVLVLIGNMLKLSKGSPCIEYRPRFESGKAKQHSDALKT